MKAGIQKIHSVECPRCHKKTAIYETTFDRLTIRPGCDCEERKNATKDKCESIMKKGTE